MAAKAGLSLGKVGQDEICNILKLLFHVPWGGGGEIAGLLLFICPRRALILRKSLFLPIPIGVCVCK